MLQLFYQQKTTMKVQEAIKTIETLGGYKFVGRRHTTNDQLRITKTAYVFECVKGHRWEHETIFDSIGQLRFYAKQFAYTHGVR